MNKTKLLRIGGSNLRNVFSECVACVVEVTGKSIIVQKKESFPMLRWPRHMHSSVCMDSSIIIIGGRQGNEQKVTKSVERCCATELEWSEMPSLHVPRAAPGACFDPHLRQLVVTGGISTSDRVLASVELLTEHGINWCTLPPLREARHRHACAAVNSKVYCLGGLQGGALKTVEALDLKSGTAWEAVSPMQQNRFDAGCAVVCGCIFVVGGSSGVRHQSSVEALDTRGNVWLKVPPLCVARAQPAVAVLSGRWIAVFGGVDPTNKRLVQSIEILDFSRNAPKWVVMGDIKDPELFNQTASVDVLLAEHFTMFDDVAPLTYERLLESLSPVSPTPSPTSTKGPSTSECKLETDSAKVSDTRRKSLHWRRQRRAGDPMSGIATFAVQGSPSQGEGIGVKVLSDTGILVPHALKTNSSTDILIPKKEEWTISAVPFEDKCTTGIPGRKAWSLEDDKQPLKGILDPTETEADKHGWRDITNALGHASDEDATQGLGQDEFRDQTRKTMYSQEPHQTQTRETAAAQSQHPDLVTVQLPSRLSESQNGGGSPLRPSLLHGFRSADSPDQSMKSDGTAPSFEVINHSLSPKSGFVGPTFGTTVSFGTIPELRRSKILSMTLPPTTMSCVPPYDPRSQRALVRRASCPAAPRVRWLSDTVQVKEEDCQKRPFSFVGTRIDFVDGSEVDSSERSSDRSMLRFLRAVRIFGWLRVGAYSDPVSWLDAA